MGDFTTVDEVKSLFRRLKIEPETGDETTNTVLTTEEVEQFISENEAMIKARLSTCYDTTNIGTESLKILNMVTKYFVADIIRGILELTTNNSERKTQDLGPSWAMKAKKMLEKICPEVNCGECRERPTMPLPDTPLLDLPPAGQALFSSSENTPQFTKSGINW